MKRRAFLKTLGGVITAMATAPGIAAAERILPSVPTPMTAEFLSLDQVNAFAFALHAEVFPEHKREYQRRAMAALRHHRERQARRRPRS